MSLNPNDISIIHWFSELEKHKCGYCKNENSSVSYGMWAETLTVDDYQNLIDRGWRRSGKYCYKPIMKETCCPQYTIRCSALNFKATKSQKKIVKKFNKFLKDGQIKQNDINVEHNENSPSDADIFMRERPSAAMDFSQIMDVKMSSEEAETSTCKAETSLPINCSPTVQNIIKKNNIENNSKLPVKIIKQGLGADPTKPPCKKAKVLRLEKKQEKMAQQSSNKAQKLLKNEEKTLDDLLNECDVDNKHKLQIKTFFANSSDPEWERMIEIEFELYKKYQICVHNDPPEKCTIKSFTRFLISSPLKIKLVQLTNDDENFNITARLYAKYQTYIHNDEESECAEAAFSDFLVTTPLKDVRFSKDDEIGFGSFHQQYWLDDKLIAVGVIDILPKCISSVYFFYDPDYRNLTLGTYASLREIQFTKTLHEIMPSIEHYYMGFYIHSCPKMRYKGKLVPSDLLCPETYDWFPIDTCLPKLDNTKYSRLNEDTKAIDLNACSAKDIDLIKIIINYRFCTYKNYKYKSKYADVFKNIGHLVGKLCAKSLLIVSPNDS